MTSPPLPRSLAPRSRPIRPALVLAITVAGAWLAAVGPAGAQVPVSPAVAGAAPSQEGVPAPPTLDLTMEAAVQMAMEANLGLQASRLDLEAADRGILGKPTLLEPLFQQTSFLQEAFLTLKEVLLFKPACADVLAHLCNLYLSNFSKRTL